MVEEYIPRRAALNSVCEDCSAQNDCRKNERCVDYERIKSIPAADVFPVVRCRECIHGRFKHQDMYECLHDADIDEETGVPYGFIDFHEPDFFCGYGKKKEET